MLMPTQELFMLQNVGKATFKDLERLGISSIQQLAHADPDELFNRLETLTKQAQNPCVWDVLAAIIHEAKTGEKTPWWQWSKVRLLKNKVLSIRSRSILPNKRSAFGKMA